MNARTARIVSIAAAVFAAVTTCKLDAAIQIQVTPSLPSPQGVGTAIVFTASATNTNPGPTTFKFEIAGPTLPAYTLLRDFNLTNSFSWFPTTPEGSYFIRVTARDFLAGETSQKVVPFNLTTRLVGGQASVVASNHPLVALFSAPPCATGSFVRVIFSKTGAASPSVTNFRPCRAASNAILVAGLYPSTSYTMNYQILTGTSVTNGPTPLTFQSGSIPASVPVAPTTVLMNPTADSSPTERINLMGFPNPYTPAGYDKAGRVLWYYPDFASGAQLVRPLAGGTMLLIASGSGTGTGFYGPNARRQQILKEVDLAGNVIHEICGDRVSEVLMAQGKDAIGRFNHDAIRLANGHTVVLADAQRAYPAGTQGSPVPVDIIGAVILDFDANWNLVWSWNAFDHAAGNGELDINREAIRKEVCSLGPGGQTQIGCPPAFLPGFTSARDWLHSNSLDLMQDGGLIMSVRDQDWVVKIDYANGTGTGDILWRLGIDGDFSFINNQGDSFPWFTAQHEVAFEFNGDEYLSIFDNGNTRVIQQGGKSRGQVLRLDQNAMTATFAVNANLGVFSPAHGSAQVLSNGNWTFQADVGTSGGTQNIETLGDTSTQVYNLQGPIASYRCWRLRDFYAPPKN